VFRRQLREAIVASVLSLVERGWRGARECSLALSQRGIPVTHLVKGWVGREVRSMIHPHPLIRVIDVPRRLFRVRLGMILLGDLLARHIRWVLIDNDRTLRQLRWWCRLFGVTLVCIRDVQAGYELTVDGRARGADEVFGWGSP